ncbi:DNA mismatch repair endonuclease MutL [Halobaculum magnesiiphilum]|uniref:DNA mismatch repair protein MutL n=1 Tax=Halobaculum magnesiiphilum TaxID=1017351 RepID=A0A8T8W933_9EURY|nr:DNA mismatch repair endonuclease MutL [Halobaculum magnesiiphilum]QZP36273.1 DNA mismatch repair endonuclease MutL [Halobaculum magnesiiphilum]
MSEESSGTAVRELSEDTVERIAAGEVITRPARVVAELVENALDAGADRIEVAVDGDGTDRIRVADDGRGMGREDAARAVEPHTTSKIRAADDLRTSTTMGFRGEALAAIADAGDLDLVTSDGAAVGTRVTVSDGEKTVEDAGRGRGTTAVVTDLFGDRPARRESLASPAREFGRISELLTSYALARPEVAFSLDHDGRETASTPGTGLRDALVALYGRETGGESTAVTHRAGVDLADRSADLTVEGRLCYPSTTRSTREHVHVAVNGRPVRDDDLRKAVARGYGSLLPNGREPVAVVRLDLPAWAVDPNVHPAKERVAIRGGDAVADAVEAGVREALTTADLRRSGEVAMDLDSSLSPAEATESDFADATVLGVFRDLYVVCEAGEDLLVVDQHAAHERVNFERLREALADEAVPSSELDPAETVTLDPPTAAAVEEHREELATLGFSVDPFGGTTYRVTAVPAPLGRVADADSLRGVATDLRESGGRGGDAAAALREDLLADLACHPSLKAGDALDRETAGRLVERLGECEQPYACPHGRPTVLSVGASTLADGFERHGSR